jgi:hypothetical protein
VHVTCATRCLVQLKLSLTTIVHAGHHGELPAFPSISSYALKIYLKIFPSQARCYPSPRSSIQPCRSALGRVQHRSLDSPSLPEHLRLRCCNVSYQPSSRRHRASGVHPPICACRLTCPCSHSPTGLGTSPHGQEVVPNLHRIYVTMQTRAVYPSENVLFFHRFLHMTLVAPVSPKGWQRQVPIRNPVNRHVELV